MTTQWPPAQDHSDPDWTPATFSVPPAPFDATGPGSTSPGGGRDRHSGGSGDSGGSGGADGGDPSGGRRFRWSRWAWIPYVLIAAFVGFWAATHIGAVVSGATSWRAIAFGIGAGVLALALLFGVARVTRQGWAGQLAGLVPLVIAVVIAVLPSYVSTTVNEAAPEGLPPASAAADTIPPGGTAPSGQSTEPPVATGGELPAPSSVPEPSTQPETSGPVEISAGQFAGIDHDAAGTARLIQLADGSLIVRFEQFSVEPGPDYDVYLISGADVSTPSDGILLGDLKGNVGDQNYDVPAGSLTGSVSPVTVLIWCTVFTVPVANATL